MNKPEKKFRAGAISATIWKNVGEKNGAEYAFNTITLGRSYKDKDGQWKTSGSLRLTDLPRAALVLNKAYEHLVISNESAVTVSEEDLGE